MNHQLLVTAICMAVILSPIVFVVVRDLLELRKIKREHAERLKQIQREVNEILEVRK